MICCTKLNIEGTAYALGKFSLKSHINWKEPWLLLKLFIFRIIPHLQKCSISVFHSTVRDIKALILIKEYHFPTIIIFPKQTITDKKCWICRLFYRTDHLPKWLDKNSSDVYVLNFPHVPFRVHLLQESFFQVMQILFLRRARLLRTTSLTKRWIVWNPHGASSCVEYLSELFTSCLQVNTCCIHHPFIISSI